ncbi:TPA: retron St85 family effector protein [Klebsiella aerogenes]|nr:retron St85 family effector protein [Klebsiella aerogenes]HBY1602205.1 retron St85 family effector protein [Klebsiella aerogenes]HBY1640722.1 retron St85 family effector protein [Klebsiella aerogenes]
MWIQHPKYKNARSDFVRNFSASELTQLSYSLPKILFICGGEESSCGNRGILEKYITKHHKEYLTFRAELAWEVISHSKFESNKVVNALALEEWLADFSDIVIILVESYGTVAELGAFSLSDGLRKKLLPILDKKYERDLSFINTGPVMWVNNDSKFKPAIYTDFTTILTSIPEINDRLSRKTRSSISNENSYGKYRYSPKVLLFFLLYVIASLGPIPSNEIVKLTEEIIDLKEKTKSRNTIHFMLSLGVALGLFRISWNGEIALYSCIDFDKFFNHETTKKILNNILKSRARALSDLVLIKGFKDELRTVMKNAS